MSEENIIEISDEDKQEERIDVVEHYREQLTYESDNLVCKDSQGNVVTSFRNVVTLLGIISTHESNPDIDIDVIKNSLHALGMNLTMMDIQVIEDHHKNVTIPYGKAIMPPYEMYENFSSGILFTSILRYLGVVSIEPRRVINNHDILDHITTTLTPLFQTYSLSKSMLESKDDGVNEKIRNVLELLNNLGELDGRS